MAKTQSPSQAIAEALFALESIGGAGLALRDRATWPIGRIRTSAGGSLPRLPWECYSARRRARRELGEERCRQRAGAAVPRASRFLRKPGSSSSPRTSRCWPRPWPTCTARSSPRTRASPPSYAEALRSGL